MTIKRGDYVTNENCFEKRQAHRWLFGLLFGSMMLFFAMTIYALDLSWRGNREAGEVLRLVERHIAAEAVVERSVRERLDRIQVDVRETRDFLMKVLQERRSVKITKTKEEEKP